MAEDLCGIQHGNLQVVVIADKLLNEDLFHARENNKTSQYIKNNTGTLTNE